jgi:hypothetical protein
MDSGEKMPTNRDRSLAATATLDMIAESDLPGIAFTAGELCEKLDIPRWRLQKFISSPHYDVSFSKQFGGVGPGTRRMFSVEDAVLIGVAAFLLQDGFAPRLVGEMLQKIDPDVVNGRYVHNNGKEESVEWGLALKRGEEWPTVTLDAWKKLDKVKAYYLLNLQELISTLKSRLGV